MLNTSLIGILILLSFLNILLLLLLLLNVVILSLRLIFYKVANYIRKFHLTFIPVWVVWILTPRRCWVIWVLIILWIILKMTLSLIIVTQLIRMSWIFVSVIGLLILAISTATTITTMILIRIMIRIMVRVELVILVFFGNTIAVMLIIWRLMLHHFY